jgi:hypothetical protein
MVDGHDDAELKVSLSVPVSTVGGTHDNLGNPLFPEVAGYLTFTPANPSMNGGVALHVPYYFVPRARSDVFVLATEPLSTHDPESDIALVNPKGAITGNGDFYAWGLSGKPQGMKFYDTRAVGVQSNPNPFSATDRILVFAINTFHRFSAPSGAEFDILIDVNGDGKPDFDLVGIDLGVLTAGASNGQYAAALINLKTGAATINFLADAPTDGSTVLLPVQAADLGIDAKNPRFSYTETTFNLLDGTQSSLPGTGHFNAFTPSISNALFVPVAPNQLQIVPVAINPAEWSKTPALGLMVAVEDNHSGERQATLIPVHK